MYAASEDWGGTGASMTATLPDRIARAGGELAALVTGPAIAGPRRDTATGDLFA
ncbi:hypothetical protein ACFYOP_16920 [Streptomyces sp. NPDC006294]|uniref:hypothetical protein n=1 Tax=Streptomyces sp. NPDC006294 TaxID=3364743 RepID=UPI003685827C